MNLFYFSFKFISNLETELEFKRSYSFNSEYRQTRGRTLCNLAVNYRYDTKDPANLISHLMLEKLKERLCRSIRWMRDIDTLCQSTSEPFPHQPLTQTGSTSPLLTLEGLSAADAEEMSERSLLKMFTCDTAF